MQPLAVLLLPTFLLFSLVSAQFDFFGNLFGQQHHHQQQQQQQQQQRSGASQWAAYSESVSCSHYLCPKTLDCVQSPGDCPCPDAEDIRCVVPGMDDDEDDATFVCVRGHDGCAEVDRLTRKGQKA